MSHDVDDYWQNLTPESAILARVFLEHCVSTHSEAALESAALPVVTAFAFHIQEAYNSLVNLMHQSDLLGESNDEEEDAEEEELAKLEVVLGELLRMGLKLDYADEIGRRKVFSVVSKSPASESSRSAHSAQRIC